MLRGMATGAVIMTAFGLVWILWGIRLLRLPSRISLALSMAAVVFAGSLFAIEIPRLAEPATASEQLYWHHIRGRFVLINFMQYTAILIAIAVCLRLRRRDLLPISISLIVGVHFIPLAGVFGFPPYYAAAAGIIVLNLGASLLESPVREATSCLGTGCVLWLSSLFVQLRSSSLV